MVLLLPFVLCTAVAQYNFQNKKSAMKYKIFTTPRLLNFQNGKKNTVVTVKKILREGYCRACSDRTRANRVKL